VVQRKWMEVAAFDTYATGASDFSPSLIKARAQNAQLLVPIFDMPRVEFC